MNEKREITFLPPGVRVYFPRDSMSKRHLLNRLFDEAERWNFGELDLPTLDYYESITRGVSKNLSLRTYQFQDDEGQLLALRPDATAQVAKILSGRFPGSQLSGRYCYSCRNFRAFELRRGELREFHQFGAEILSEHRFEADVELLMFLFELIEKMELGDFVLDLGHVDVYKGLVEDVKLTAEESEALWQNIHRKNTGDLRTVLEELEIPDDRKRILLALPTMFGGDEIFDEVDSFNGASESTRRAIDELQRLYQKLEQARLHDCVSLDLGIVRDLDYYTGMVFEALIPDTGKPVIGGGRYDSLYGTYGDPIPATGFALELDRLLPQYDGAPAPPQKKRVWCPDPTPDARQQLSKLRRDYQVDVTFGDPSGDASGVLVLDDGEMISLPE